MLNKYILVAAALFCCLAQTQGSFGQTSQELNNQGCDALVNHDYAQAEKLFTAAYREAAKTHDTKRMATALTNLKELYARQGCDDKVKRVEVLETQIDHLAIRKTDSTRLAENSQNLSISDPFGIDQLPDSSGQSNYSFAHSIGRLITNANYSGQEAGKSGFEILALGQNRKLDRSTCHMMMSAVENGGAIIELENGYLLEVAQEVDQDDWQLGDAVAVGEHPRLSLPFVALINKNGHVLGAKIVATR